MLLLIKYQTELLWAKSLPSKIDSLELSFNLLPTSQTEPLCQLHFSSGAGAFFQGISANLPEREYKPPIKTIETFETGFVLPFTRVGSVEPLDLSIACFAKADVVVRRRYVWGLKPPFLGDLESPWDQILARGRNGVVSLKGRSISTR